VPQLEFLQRHHHTLAGESYGGFPNLLLAVGKIVVERPLWSTGQFGDFVDSGCSVSVAEALLLPARSRLDVWEVWICSSSCPVNSVRRLCTISKISYYIDRSRLTLWVCDQYAIRIATARPGSTTYSKLSVPQPVLIKDHASLVRSHIDLPLMSLLLMALYVTGFRFRNPRVG
jgi:hypothetical protein